MADPQHNDKAHHTASKIGQLLGEIIIHHAPVTSQIASETAQRIKDEWLEGLEDHATEVISPLIDQVLQSADPESAVAGLLEHAARPTAQFGSTIQQFFVYGVMFGLANTALAPFTQDLANVIWKANPTRPLSPADLATALTQAVGFADSQGVEIPDWAAEEASFSGVNLERFKTIVGAAGMAPDATDLFEMFRRGIITTEQLQNGFLEGPTKNKWIPSLTKLQYVPLTISDMVRAAVQAQLPYADAEDLAHKLGLEPQGWIEGNPDWFKIAFDISGRPPGPVEMAHAANRGIIPWEGTGDSELTFQQAIAESDIKTKWTPILKAISVYWPPPGETEGLYVSGGITLEQAKTFWKGSGLPQALTDAFSHKSTVQEIETEKALAKGNVLTLLYDGIISQQVALELLDTLGYSGKTATYMVEITNFRREIRAIDMAARKVGQLFLNFKITTTDALKTLQGLGIPDDQAHSLMGIWEVERTPQVRIPSIGQIGKAVKYGGLSWDEAVQKAELLGYTQYDAVLVIASEAEMPPPNGYPVDTNSGVRV